MSRRHGSNGRSPRETLPGSPDALRHRLGDLQREYLRLLHHRDKFTGVRGRTVTRDKREAVERALEKIGAWIGECETRLTALTRVR